MKLIAISGDKKYYRIGETFENSAWYEVTDEVKQWAEKIKKGETVNIKSKKSEDGKKNILLFIAKGDTTSTSLPTPPSTTDAPTVTPTSEPSISITNEGLTYPTEYSRPKTPEERADIRNQAKGHMVSRTIIGLQGQISLDNIEETIDRLFKKYTEKVG